MPKKKKTRTQKIISDMRHREHIERPKTLNENNQVPTIALEPRQTISQAIVLSGFSYLYSDLGKTIILTLSIIIAELLLKFLLKA